ncbi:ABC transporter ATP-binding protein [Betaproteobacteria bacterium]|nr:ABC transporter ATP-binding protein [Betaproteobacteria bacterium]GHU27422.1 ABC transporter ATP-binding protein [Betaproteobacteria bacterium]
MEQLSFLLSLIRRAGDARKRLYVASIIAGALQGLLLLVISSSIEALSKDGSLPLRQFLLFILSLIGLYKCLQTSMGISSAVARDLVTGFEVRISEKISQTSYACFKSLDRGAIYDAITGSKDIINESAIMLPIFISGMTMLACSLLFSLYISVVGMISVLLVMGLAAVVFFNSDKRFIQALMAYRASMGDFQSALKDVILGFTELKMNESRRLSLFNELIRPFSKEVVEKRVLADGYRVKNTVMYGLMVYFPVGALLFILPQTGLVTLQESVKIVAITMFSTIPLIGLLSFMPLAARSAFIVRSLENFEATLDAERDPENFSPLAKTLPAFESMQIQNAIYSYPDAKGGIKPFTLDVDNFTLQKGELVILCGGNGSGKSTLMHALAGLETFKTGDVFLNGRHLAEWGGAGYRAFFSVLFPDFHLFSGLFGITPPPERVHALLKRMALTEKVSYDENTRRFSTTALSSGQRKRLALICAILEDRPVLLFDEVAADFDHHFRELFYRELLPELKKEGRTILVVSHDNRYFSVADRVLTLQYGRFVASSVEGGS